jgi:hypothetical protein
MIQIASSLREAVSGGLNAFLRARGPSHPISPLEWPEFQKLSRSERRTILRNREKRLVDVWSDPLGYRPPARHMGEDGTNWVGVRSNIIADGAQVSNTTTETILCPDYSIAGGYMFPYRALRLWAFGVNSNVVTTPGTFIFRVRWGGVAGTVLLASAAQGLDTTAHTNAIWAMQAYIVCRTEGATGSFMSGGWFEMFGLLSSTAANLLPALLGSAGAPGASGNVAVTVDTTVAKLLSITGTSSVATSPTNQTCQQRVIESLN